MFYWREVWQKRSPTKLFSLYRAIPSVVISSFQFLRQPKLPPRPLHELGVIVGTILGVYLALYVLETAWHFIATPSRLHAEQGSVIADLQEQLAQPRVSAQEERQRKRVSEILKDFSTDEKFVLRYVLDHGETGYGNLEGSGMEKTAFAEATRKGVICQLLVSREVEPHGKLAQMAGGLMWERRCTVNPLLESALKFALEQQEDNAGPTRPQPPALKNKK